MTSLVHAALRVRRTARASLGLLGFAAGTIVVWLGAFRVAPEALGFEHLLIAVAWVAVLTARQRARSKTKEGTEGAFIADLELCLLLLLGVHAVVQLGGGLTGYLYPLVYVLVAFVSAFTRPAVGVPLILSAVAFEGVLFFVTERRDDVRTFATHALFIVFFGVLNLLFTRVEIARVRERSRRELDQERVKVREDARLFRLVGSVADGAPRDEDRLFRSSVDEVKQSLFHTLELLRQSLDLHTAILLMRGESETELRLVEVSSASEDVVEGTVPLGEGVVGAVMRRGEPMALEQLKPGYKGISYYRGPSIVRSFLGMPVIENGQTRGVLCVDREDGKPFGKREEQVLAAAAKQALRLLENERVFVQLERGKREQSILHRASQVLGSALTEEAVIDGGLAAAVEIAPYDFAAVTLYDRERKKHSVIRAVGDGSESLARLSFRDNTSLTAMAVHNRHYLPYRGEFDAAQQVVYTRRANLRGMESLLILPLIVREDAIGTLALAARRRDAFGDAVRPALQVLANQLAVALANAASVRRLEELATTDGATGCLNKRAFLDELEKRIKSADRFQRKLSLIVTDLDHFKLVNDTYGHATGDVVIKGLADVLQRAKRETDVVCRFGGEEFCVLCEETDTEGAMLLAERVRQELGQTVFTSELGKLSVTCSLGVATFPRNGRDGKALFEAADRALYAAKHGGRNRVSPA